MSLHLRDLLHVANEIRSIYGSLSEEYREKFKSIFRDARGLLDAMKEKPAHEKQAMIDYLIEEMRRIKAEILGR